MPRFLLFTALVCSFALSPVLEAQTATPPVDPSQYSFLLGECDRTGTDYRAVYGIVSKDVDLSSDNTARTLLQLAANVGQAECPKRDFSNIHVYLYYGHPATFTADQFTYKTTTRSAFYEAVSQAYGDKAYGSPGAAVVARSYPPSSNLAKLNWFEYSNHAKELKETAARAARAAEDAKRREAAAVEQKRRAEAQARAAALRTESFLKTAGSRQIVPLYDICQNPFMYQGKVVVFKLTGLWEWKAASPTSALIGGLDISCEFLMSGIPAQLLTRTFSDSKVIAVKVLGRTQGIPTVQYVHHERCSDRGCADMPGIR